MDVEKFERRMWNIIAVVWSVFSSAIAIWFTYLVLLYSFS